MGNREEDRKGGLDIGLRKSHLGVGTEKRVLATC